MCVGMLFTNTLLSPLHAATEKGLIQTQLHACVTANTSNQCPPLFTRVCGPFKLYAATIRYMPITLGLLFVLTAFPIATHIVEP